MLKRHSDKLIQENAKMKELLRVFIVWHSLDGETSQEMYRDQLNQALIEARKLVQK